MTAPFTNKLMKNLLEDVRVGINNLRKNPDVMEQVSNYGLDEESLKYGENLYRETEQLFIGKGPTAGRKVGSSIRINEMMDNVYDDFMFYVRLIRTDLKYDPALLREFNLKGRRDTSFMGKIKEPKSFYSNCLDNPKMGEYVIKYGLTAEKIQGYLDEIAGIELELENRATLKKDKELNTQKRNRLFRRLSDWHLNFKRILMHIFQDEPQKLEEYKIKAYSAGYKPASKKKNNGDNQDNGGEKKDDNPQKGTNGKGKAKTLNN